VVSSGTDWPRAQKKYDSSATGWSWRLTSNRKPSLVLEPLSGFLEVDGEAYSSGGADCLTQKRALTQYWKKMRSTMPMRRSVSFFLFNSLSLWWSRQRCTLPKRYPLPNIWLSILHWVYCFTRVRVSKDDLVALKFANLEPAYIPHLFTSRPEERTSQTGCRSLDSGEP